jgi:hypothetical protein
MARSEARAQHNGLLEVTVIDRWIPLVSAAYCMRVARPARTAMLLTWRRRLPAHPAGEAGPGGPCVAAGPAGGRLRRHPYQVEVRAAWQCHDGCTMRLCPRAPPVETETRYRDRGDRCPSVAPQRSLCLHRASESEDALREPPMEGKAAVTLSNDKSPSRYRPCKESHPAASGRQHPPCAPRRPVLLTAVAPFDAWRP